VGELEGGEDEGVGYQGGEEADEAFDVRVRGQQFVCQEAACEARDDAVQREDYYGEKNILGLISWIS